MPGVITTSSLVSHLVTEKPSRARVFEKYDIPFCDASVTVEAACNAAGVSSEKLIGDLEQHDNEIIVFDELTLDMQHADSTVAELIDNILKQHHVSMRREIRRIMELFDSAIAMHGQKHPMLIDLQAHFAQMADAFETHLGHEEVNLFPVARRVELEGGATRGLAAMVREAVEEMFDEHDNTPAAWTKVERDTGMYTLPADAGNSWRVLYDRLKALRLDMLIHTYKENEILAPKILAYLNDED